MFGHLRILKKPDKVAGLIIAVFINGSYGRADRQSLHAGRETRDLVCQVGSRTPLLAARASSGCGLEGFGLGSVAGCECFFDLTNERGTRERRALLTSVRRAILRVAFSAEVDWPWMPLSRIRTNSATAATLQLLPTQQW